MATASPSVPLIVRRPTSTEGVWGWITTVDHKRIGILYAVTSFIFFLLGGIEALLIRLQLAQPESDLLSADAYNQLFTMHGTTMVFLVVMPMSAAFFNYLIPLMIGARDVAFPRLNALSYWIYLFGGIFINAGFLYGDAPDGGWFGYANLTQEAFLPGDGIDYWALGLQILGISTMMSAFNFAVTIINLRAPGMTMMRLPVFAWMTLVVAFLVITAFPVITVALFQVSFDRFYEANFYNTAKGGDPVLWQHMFWLFGHPEVYILILPAMGIVSEVLPTFSKKPLFGYPFVIFSGIAIGFMGWGVWAHHMFTVGLGSVAVSAFGISTMLIAVPTGVKIFNWLATMWGGAIRFTPAMLFAIGFIAMFTTGGLTGVTHAIVPADSQQQDTYYIVSHFHQVLFGGAIFALFAGFYYWFPKMTGRMLNDTLGHIHFWGMLIGFNLTFQPMMILGLNGMPRRVFEYPEGMGWDLWNLVATVGAFMIAVSVLAFMINIVRSWRSGERAPADPWDGRTLEWSIPSPPPHYNFAEIPVVHARDPFWHQKYIEDAQGRAIPIPAGGAIDVEEHGEEHADIHMPSPSYFPVIIALGLPLMAAGLMFGYWITAIGGVILALGVFGMAMEPPDAHGEHA
ncbi:MAG TPA: cytochrome c oxidase subunit I [Dehalococcoidia bacterium]|nr:cytochrome c oxidase subunit I [Dehalococcoidia bacterium]